MALKVELKPGEKVVIGDALIINDDQRTRLFIEGDTPILREKDILTPATADTPARRVYLAVQMMYLSRELATFQKDYFNLINDIIRAAPSAIPFVTRISNHIMGNRLYQALKEARALIAHERKLLDNAKSGG